VIDLGEISEHRLKYTAVCMKFIVASRLRPLGNKFELLMQVMETINSYLPAEKQLSEEQLETVSKAAKSLKAIKPS
jgi:hypothetical protein